MEAHLLRNLYSVTNDRKMPCTHISRYGDHMHIIEQFCQGKRDDQSLNEDGLIITDEFAAVVDGVTSKSVRHLWHPSAGVVTKNLLLDEISQLAPDVTMRQTQAALDERLHAQYENCTTDDATVFTSEPWERLQANAVIYSAYQHEAWLFGDCQIMVNSVHIPTVKRVDVLLGDLRAFVTQALELSPESVEQTASAATTSDPTRDMIMPFLRLQSRFANQRGEYGYFVFDGFTDLTYPIRTVSINPGDDVVLASDGYPLLRPTLTESEQELNRLHITDPQLTHEYRTTKGFSPDLASFDDRTYLRFIA